MQWPHLPRLAFQLRTSTALTSLSERYDTISNDEHGFAVLGSLAKLSVALLPQTDCTYRAAPEDEAIDFVYLRSYFQDVGETLAKTETRPGSATTCGRKLLEALQATLSESPCENCCPQKSGNTCKWTAKSQEQDVHLWKSSAQCVEPLREIFSFAKTIASELYELALPENGVNVGELGIKYLGVSPENPVNAITNESSLTQRGVDFMVDPEGFNHDSYLGLPYVFFHECIAHAFCGVSLKKKPAVATNFHEGWMDEVANLVLRFSIEDPYCSMVGWAGRDEALEAMERFRTQRFSQPKSRSREVAMRVEGRNAFIIFADAMRRATMSSQTSKDYVHLAVDFSLTLNASAINQEARASFVSTLASIYGGATAHERADRLAANPVLLSECVSFCNGKKGLMEVELLVNSVLSIRLTEPQT